MDPKFVVAVLNIVAVVLGVGLDTIIYNYTCFLCSNDLYWFQFLNCEILGTHLVVFFVVIAFFAKEEVPKKLQLAISFLATIFYAHATCVLFYLYFGDYQTIRVLFGVLFGSVVAVIHLVVALLVLFKT